MLTRSKKIRSFLIITFLSLITPAFILMGNDSFAERREKRIGKSHRVDRRSTGSYDRQRGKRRIVSPRVFRRGHVIERLPTGYRRVWHKKVPYYYYRGAFYRPAQTGFIVVGPPVGAVVVALPVGYSRIWVGSTVYYTYGGVFYRRVPYGYVVVDAPSEVIIEEDAPAIVQPSKADAGKVSVTADVLNVRTGPGLDYPVIYQIHEGYILEVHGRDLGWLYVELPNGEFGWVMNIHTTRLESPGRG